MKFLDDYKEQGYALLRIVTGYLFLWHGTQRFLDFPSEWPWGELNLLQTVGGSIEMIGGTLILVGLLTRTAAFICSGPTGFTMPRRVILSFRLPITAIWR